jgi:peptidyl-prolyl cis-trans isomerase C
MVARVGDKIISGKQIDKFLENLPPQVSARYGAARIRREIADGFVSMEMLAWEARKRGIDKREDVKLKMDLIVDQSLARELEEDIRKGIKVSDADTKKYYDEHQDKYGARTRVFARQIMLASEPEAKSAADKIKKGGNFEDLAKQLSKDPETAAKGGDIGLVTPGKLDPALEKAVFSLKEGETSPVVKTAKGFYILKAERVATSKERPYEEVKKSIENLIMREKVNKAIGDLKAEVKKKAKVEVNEKYFAQFKDAAPAPAPFPTPDPEMPE